MYLEVNITPGEQSIIDELLIGHDEKTKLKPVWYMAKSLVGDGLFYLPLVCMQLTKRSLQLIKTSFVQGGAFKYTEKNHAILYNTCEDF